MKFDFFLPSRSEISNTVTDYTSSSCWSQKAGHVSVVCQKALSWSEYLNHIFLEDHCLALAWYLMNVFCDLITHYRFPISIGRLCGLISFLDFCQLTMPGLLRKWLMCILSWKRRKGKGRRKVTLRTFFKPLYEQYSRTQARWCHQQQHLLTFPWVDGIANYIVAIVKNILSRFLKAIKYENQELWQKVCKITYLGGSWRFDVQIRYWYF